MLQEKNSWLLFASQGRGNQLVISFSHKSDATHRPFHSRQDEPASTSGLPDTVTSFALRKEQHKAEILWALKSVVSHFPYMLPDNLFA